MSANTTSQLTDINNKLISIQGELKTVSNILSGSGYGEDGIIQKEKQDREEIKKVKEDLNSLKRIRMEIALIGGMMGALLKAMFDWVIKMNDEQPVD